MAEFMVERRQQLGRRSARFLDGGTDPPAEIPDGRDAETEAIQPSRCIGEAEGQFRPAENKSLGRDLRSWRVFGQDRAVQQEVQDHDRFREAIMVLGRLQWVQTLSYRMFDGEPDPRRPKTR